MWSCTRATKVVACGEKVVAFRQFREEVRARHRKIERAWPQRPTATGDVLLEKLEVKPHAIARAGFTVTYEF